MIKKIILVFILLLIISLGISYFNAIKESEGESYLACGCGCCGGESPKEQCIFKSKGDSLNEIIRKDILSSKKPTCSVVGCTKGTLYKYCD